ncbi:hypothetical protein DFH09DRAFT_1227327 [Mycena vulgaris]|nr:hypothetical protein DFH09DRAFT_1227327 [Mycena vulgaris]
MAPLFSFLFSPPKVHLTIPSSLHAFGYTHCVRRPGPRTPTTNWNQKCPCRAHSTSSASWKGGFFCRVVKELSRIPRRSGWVRYCTLKIKLPVNEKSLPE